MSRRTLLRAAGLWGAGSYEISYDRELWHHHLLDPVSGLSAVHHVSVTVRSASAVAAALATALFMLDRPQVLKLADSLENTACLIVDRNRRRYPSNRWV